MTEYQDYHFLTNDDFHKKKANGNYIRLVQLKMFKEHGQIDHDKTLYFEVFHDDEHSLKSCIADIKRMEGANCKSFLEEIIIPS